MKFLHGVFRFPVFCICIFQKKYPLHGFLFNKSIEVMLPPNFCIAQFFSLSHFSVRLTRRTKNTIKRRRIITENKNSHSLIPQKSVKNHNLGWHCLFSVYNNLSPEICPRGQISRAYARLAASPQNCNYCIIQSFCLRQKTAFRRAGLHRLIYGIIISAPKFAREVKFPVLTHGLRLHRKTVIIVSYNPFVCDKRRRSAAPVYTGWFMV